VPGIDHPHVVTARQLLEGSGVGRKIVVGDWDGRNMGMSVAEHLAVRGHEVEIVSTTMYIGEDAELMTWHPAYERLQNLGVKLTALAEIIEVKPGGAVVRALNGGLTEVTCDNVVVCSRGSAAEELYLGLKGKVPRLYLIGDAYSPRQLEQAVYEGAKIAREI
jgi:hypothetical protein